MQPTNLLFIMSDEHNKHVLGCYGHPTIRTPNLDALAARGTRFTNAYTNCPICVPARASFATGQPERVTGVLDFQLNIQRRPGLQFIRPTLNQSDSRA